ncbi:hypothetical protein LAZ67_20001743 [Cordylochernes scorpioides]|uniref:Uncharacterized protein n=1 Tax=Cordylochernes scorpioides TaxID=51811 RepID=A0ABY6LK93_9ARAC|nr:hypothetical protein LAZ67_20001743 [Cordylochernes scorpioides]
MTAYKRKARLVAVGCNQRYGVDYKEFFSPVLKKESLGTIVVLATQQNLRQYTRDNQMVLCKNEKKTKCANWKEPVWSTTIRKMLEQKDQ